MKKVILFVFIFLIISSSAFAAVGDDPAVLYNKGIDYYEQDKMEESIAAFKKAIAIDPQFYEAYYNLARVQETAGKTQDAMATYEKLLQIEPADYESAYQYAELLYKNGYLSKSSTYLAKIPSNSEYKTKANTLQAKIIKRQNELAQESRVKAQQSLKSAVVGNIPAPSGLVIDSSGNMYIASFSESKIIKISRNGQNKVVYADKNKGLDGPIGLAIDSQNNIYVANYNKGNIIVFDKTGNFTVLMYVKKPYCISLDETAAKIYVTEQQNNSVISYDISDILSKGASAKVAPEVPSSGINQVMTFPVSDRAPLGVPSVVESNFTRTNPQNSISSPIMIPAGDLY